MLGSAASVGVVWAPIILAALALAGGLAALWKFAGNSGANDAADQKVRDAVLGTKDNGYTTLEQRLGARIDATRAELHPNGGKSMRDVVDRIETKVDEHVGYCKAEHDAFGRRIAEVESRG